ncbi:LLM class flavin-dependent oxidoreductase [Rhizobiaceae bacterium BDR2-2]|uniref:LLM class flavin-dependent oxidoreductase n=1 Tax=Ectorhizobium quercum TaxID=2965071 RepID=A0AAE3SUU3_9HYPH|nr:LLM class flavin-dependent oxidoreductase [Ectorhizobium quercum]MCX8997477.1 LLM class flavin-dependent oxidoreductase [Ectorhizobium quercum]
MSDHKETPRQLSLGAFLMGAGHHIAAWRDPAGAPQAALNFRNFVRAAQKAEAARFDLVFLADSASIREVESPSLELEERAVRFEPLTLLSALAAVTERIGLVGTASTTYNEPFNIARRFASLDRLSGGRAGWNLVTSSNPSDPGNFGQDALPDHAERYRRAHEFHEVVRGLWDSWDEGALLYDKAAGVLFDPQKLHPLNHAGEFYRVRGPLNVPPSPQGHPVVVQAGASDDGRETAARTAEAVFSAHQSFEEAAEFYGDVKERLSRYGRSRGSLKILPGVSPVVGRTEEEARQKFRSLQDRIDPVVGLALLRPIAGGVDLSAYPLDGPLPELPPTNAGKSRQKLLIDLARRKGLSIRELYLEIAGARGHWQLVGTPAQIADELEYFFRNEAADGFNIMPPQLDWGLDDFIELVVPELRRRGLFRSEYAGRTLRDHLGLARPVSRRASVRPVPTPAE